ncbi:cell division protein FtsL [Defluviicoccus vanus]|uniref:Cell division protein FtsL n=1 Tax=Defluviicoccus vanus TaxID=111831 RepID=A0A7H1N224_9PROT|nr:hypothetical protein [Defluviicoccus vanus]QNT69760.1 hypothetical protein HQ394_11125 [Defluviicoccus vanus]
MNGWPVFVRQTTILCLLLAVGLAVVLLALKHQVQQLSDELNALNRQYVEEQQTIRVLKAEFAYLSQPDRLRGLATQLGLVPVEPRQLATFATLDAVLAALPPEPKAAKQTASNRSSVHLVSKTRGSQR